MKRIINGKIYNTETAERIGSYSRSNPSDFSYIDESLYRTKKGRFFIAGEGGAMTRYAESGSDGTWWGASGICVLDDGEALDWCESRGIDPDIVEQYFAIEEG